MASANGDTPVTSVGDNRITRFANIAGELANEYLSAQDPEDYEFSKDSVYIAREIMGLMDEGLVDKIAEAIFDMSRQRGNDFTTAEVTALQVESLLEILVSFAAGNLWQFVEFLSEVSARQVSQEGSPV